MRFIWLVILSLNLSVLGQTETEKLVRNSEEFERLDNFPKAIEELTKAIALQPDDAKLYFRRAEIYYGTAKKEQSVADLLRAAELAPKDHEIVLRTTNLLTFFEECTSSVSILNGYISRDQKSAEVFVRRATARTCLDDPFGAFDDLLAAIELAPDSMAYRTQYLKQLSALGGSEQALDSLSKVIDILEQKQAKAKDSSLRSRMRSDLSGVYQTRAQLFHAGGDTEKEFADLARFVEYDPKFYNYQSRARLYAEHQMYVEAANDFTEAIRRTTDHPPVASFLERAEVYVLAEKYAEAVADYEAALKLEGVSNKELLEKRLLEIRNLVGNSKSQIH